MILALLRKTIFAGKVTIMCNVQAKCFDHRLPFLVVNDPILVYIFGKQLFLILKLLYLFDSLRDLRLAVCIL